MEVHDICLLKYQTCVTLDMLTLTLLALNLNELKTAQLKCNRINLNFAYFLYVHNTPHLYIGKTQQTAKIVPTHIYYSL